MGRQLVLLALALTAGCASTDSEAASAPAERARALDLGLAPVSAALVFPAEQKEVSLAWLLDELMRLTGQELACTPEARAQLEARMEPLEQTTPVPADEVYPFVETLLVYHGFALARLKEGTPTVLGLIGGERNSSEVPYLPLEVEDRAALARHPALLFQHAIHFESLDSRQLQTQLRQLLVDPMGLCNVAPAGERTLIVQGYGQRLAGLVQLLSEVDQHATQVYRPAPPPGAPAQTQPQQPPPGR